MQNSSKKKAAAPLVLVSTTPTDVAAKMTIDFGPGFGKPITWDLKSKELVAFVDQALALRQRLSRRGLRKKTREQLDSALNKCAKGFADYCKTKRNVHPNLIKDAEYALPDLGCKITLTPVKTADTQGKTEVSAAAISQKIAEDVMARRGQRQVAAK